MTGYGLWLSFSLVGRVLSLSVCKDTTVSRPSHLSTCSRSVVELTLVSLSPLNSCRLAPNAIKHGTACDAHNDNACSQPSTT